MYVLRTANIRTNIYIKKKCEGLENANSGKLQRAVCARSEYRRRPLGFCRRRRPVRYGVVTRTPFRRPGTRAFRQRRFENSVGLLPATRPGAVTRPSDRAVSRPPVDGRMSDVMRMESDYDGSLRRHMTVARRARCPADPSEPRRRKKIKTSPHFSNGHTSTNSVSAERDAPSARCSDRRAIRRVT